MQTPEKQQPLLFEHHEPLTQLRGQLVDTALHLIGAPYFCHVDYGEDAAYTHWLQMHRPSRGLDCSGLVNFVYRECGYPFVYTARHTGEILVLLGDRIQLVIPRAGDIVLVNGKDPSQGRLHCGIADGNGRVVHASFTHGSVVLDTLQAFVQKRPRFDAGTFLVGTVPAVLERLVEKR